MVPEDQRVTATKKRHELLVLRNEILTRKTSFNTYLLALRDRKKQLLEKVRATQTPSTYVHTLLMPVFTSEYATLVVMCTCVHTVYYVHIVSTVLVGLVYIRSLFTVHFY